MGIAKLYGQSGSGGKINGIIEDYYAYAGENISAGDFVEFINGIAGQRTEASADTAIYTTNGASYAGVSAVKLDENRVFIAHIVDDANYYLAGIVCTISGAKITVGTDTLINSTKNTGYAISTVLLSNGNVLIAHSLGTNYILTSTICTISGTTITVGTGTQLSQFTNSGRVISTCLFPNGKVFIAYSYGSSKYSLYGMVVTINGTTVTKGTENSLQGSDYAGASFSTCLLPNGNIFIPHSLYSSYSLYALVCTVSGTTISTNGGSTQLMTSQYSGGTISTELLPNGTVFVAHSDSSDYLLYGFVCTINGTSITKGTDTLINSTRYAGAKISSELLPSGNVFVAHSRTDSYYLDGVVVAIDGTTVTKGTGVALNTNSYSGNRISPVLLPNGNIFIAHSYSSSYHLYAQIFGIDEANNVPTNNVALKEYETQVRKATTSDIYGVAKTSGMGAYKTVEYTIPEGESVNAGETREYTINSLIKGDVIPKTWTGDEYTYTSSEGVKISCSEYGDHTTHVYKASDGDDSTFWEASLGLPRYKWIKLNFPQGVKITKMKMLMQNRYSVFTIAKLQGSNNDNSWVDLYDFTNTEISYNINWVEFTLNNADYYKQYRIYVDYPDDLSSDNGIDFRIYEWLTTEYAGAVPYTGTALQSGTAGDTIQIAVPVSDEESTGHKDVVSIYTI